MEILALIPGLIAAWYAFGKSPEASFLGVYLPVLLLLPEYYRWMAPGLPDPTFSQAAIVPIAAALLVRRSGRWAFSTGDVLVFGLAACVAYSEYRNAGYKEAQNLMFDMLAWLVLPYIVTKSLIEPLGLRIRFAKRLTFLLFVVSVISLYEFRVGATPYRLFLDRFFPWQGAGWVTTFRYGFARVAGPYGHAILAGIILVIGYRLQRWLEWSGHWEPTFKYFPKLPLNKARIITLGILGGVVMTMVRGPWIGAILAAGVTLIGRAKNRVRAVRIVAAAIVLIGLPAGYVLFSYASVGRENAKTPSQESAAYRKELIDKYVAIAMEKSTWGWGRNTWPKVEGMPSIDNYYLLLALMHGLLAVGFLVATFLVMMTRLFLRGMSLPPPLPRGSSLAFTLLGVYAAIGFSIATVFMGTQVIPLFAVITGWTEGYLLWGADGEAPAVAVGQAMPFRFERVVT